MAYVNVMICSLKILFVSDICIMLFCQLKDDPGFEEFVVAHKNRAAKAAWGNDIVIPRGGQVKGQETGGKSRKDEFDENEGENHSGILYSYLR